MATILLGLGEVAASSTAGDRLKAMALGSCVAVVIFDPAANVVGMLHIVLPESKIDILKSQKQPGFFADTGIRALIDTMLGKGSNLGQKRRWLVKIAGGAAMQQVGGMDIGKRNVLSSKRLLWGHGLGPRAEDVGGHQSRTVSIDVGSSAVQIRGGGGELWEI